MLRTLKSLSKIARTGISPLNRVAIPVSFSRNYGIYEPDYLHLLRPDVPVYDLVNIRISGYDYPILENYQKFVHEACEAMEINVEDAWAVPPKVEKIVKYKPTSVVVDGSYELKTYYRTVQISEVKAYKLPTLIHIIQNALPEGVNFNVVEHSELHDTERYVPDKELKELKEQLNEMGGPTAQKKRDKY